MSDSFLLSNARAGQSVRLVRVHAGRRFSHRLAELGLTPGVEFSVLHDNGGPLLLCVRNSRIAIGRGMANKISVDLIG
jgi:Fe2+ transport system protein FeoA